MARLEFSESIWIDIASRSDKIMRIRPDPDQDPDPQHWLIEYNYGIVFKQQKHSLLNSFRPLTVTVTPRWRKGPKAGTDPDPNTSVPDPDLPDPHVFGPPRSGSIIQRYGFGSFYH
jgi:hypothetical protein